MTRTITYQNRNHNTFGGRVYNSDFEYMNLSDVASRIMADKRFDEQCLKDRECREEYKNEEL